MMYYIGIDVSKKKLDICLLVNDIKGKRKIKSLQNDAHASKLLIEWFASHTHPGETVKIIMEATGVYHEPLANALHQAGIEVVLVNSRRVHDFAKGMGILTKTDRVDAYVLSCYGLLKQR